MAISTTIMLNSAILKNPIKVKRMRVLIPKKLHRYFILNADINRLIIFDNYLKSELEINYSTKSIIEYAIKNVSTTISGNSIKVSVNSDIVIPNTTIKVKDVISLITYGNLEIKGYNIVADAFNSLRSARFRI